MTRTASTVSFRVLLVAITAVVLLLNMTLVHARATRQLPSKADSDCTTTAVATPAPPPQATPAAPAAGSSAPPGFTAAFGSCGDSGASSPRHR